MLLEVQNAYTEVSKSGPRRHCGAVEEEAIVSDELLHLANNWAVAHICCDVSLGTSLV